MRNLYLAILLLFIASNGHTQSTLIPQQPKLSDLRERFYQQYEQMKEADPSFAEEEDEEEDGMLAKYKRWEWLMQTRLLPDGTIPSPGFAARERDNYFVTHPDVNLIRTATWTQMGTMALPNNGGGAGRINVIRLAPGNNNTIYVGTAGGGVWKSVDGGTTWSAISDNISDLSIADIAIDPANANNIYVATGDGYGYGMGSSGDFWGGLYSAGVLHSADGGATWNSTGLCYNQSDNIIVQRLVIDPSNANNLLAGTKNGLLRSTDGGTTWSQVLAGRYYDIEYNAANSATVYCAGNNNIYKSVDGGATWSSIKASVGNDRISIEVSAANSQVIYALAIGGSLLKSTDGGSTWTTQTFPTAANFFGYYDGALCCADANSNYLLAGGAALVKSIDGGTTWTGVGSGIHSDHHALLFLPGSTSTFYSGNDGGIYKTTNSGTGWTNLSAGLAIAQIYRIALAGSNPNIVYSGWQDNGSNRWDGGTSTWTKVYGSDGMDCMVDYNSSQNVYVSYQYGALLKSTNGGSSFSSIAPCSANWLTPVEMDPTTSSTIYQGCTSIYKSTNSGTSWSIIGTSLFSGSNNACADIAIAPSNVNTIYACSYTKMVKTTDGGTTWTTITGTLPVTMTGINQIAICNTDPNKVWACLGGYSSGNKVFKSTDGGTTWTNMSGTLPNIPVNSIVYENNSEDRLYIGTDVGVYYIDKNAADWIFYNDGLPNVMVHELEINYSGSKLIAGTYGRGLWQSDLVDAIVLPVQTISTSTITQNPICPNGSVSVAYVATGTFDAGNIFTAQLSNSSGSFSSPTDIGTLSSTLSGTITCTIPSNASGTGYRIRVVSSSPVVTGGNNGSNLTITCATPVSPITSTIAATSATVSWSGNVCAASYQVDYKKSGNGAWTSKTGITTASTTLTGLSKNTKYQWRVKAVCVSNPNNSSAFSTTINFKTLPVRMVEEELPKPDISIYPNPSNGNFHVRWSGDVVSIVVYNLLGQRIWMQNDVGENTSLEIHMEQPRGIYFVEVRTEDQTFKRQITID